VARLRREVARAKTATRASTIADQSQFDPDESDAGASTATLKPLQKQIELLKHVGLALRILCTEVEENPDLRAAKFTPGSPLPKQFLETLGPLQSSLDEIELLVPDLSWMLKAETHPQAIVARSRDAVPSGDGGFIRAYALGDGSIESVRHASAEEVYGWGQMTDGKAVEWDPKTGVLFMDPALARRYGLNLRGN
jgi:hypothetical protein